MRNGLSIISIIIALVLLLPGVTQPVLSISGSIDKSKLAQAGIEMLAAEDESRTRNTLLLFSSMLGLDQIEGEISAYDKTRSIWGTVTELARHNNMLVAVLVALFSIVLPVIKLLMQLCYCCLASGSAKHKLGQLIIALSKWSMVDVFVIALIVTFLAGNAHGQNGDLLVLHAEFGNGFWFFTAYCIFSISASMLIKPASKNNLN